MGQNPVSKELTIPKPDALFGSHLNRTRLRTSHYCDGSKKSIFNLDSRTVNALMRNINDFNDITCGISGYSFGFPVFAIERKSDSGSMYFAENQLFGSLICMLHAQRVAKQRVSVDLPAIALGFVNVGNFIEFWIGFDVEENGEMWHIGDYHLFNHRQAVEFISTCVRISEYIHRYQIILFNALLNVDVVQVKRDRPATSESDQGPPSKRNVKMGKKDIITTYNTTTEDDSVSPTTVGTTQRSGVVKEHFEDVTHIGTYEELEIDTHSDNGYDFVEGQGITTADVLHYLNSMESTNEVEAC